MHLVKKLLKAGGAYKSGAVHLRATVHDRSALKVKKMIVNGQDLVPPFQGLDRKIYHLRPCQSLKLFPHKFWQNEKK